MLTEVLSTVLAQAGPEQSPIPSRWQHAAVPAWCPVPPTIVCEVSYTTLDLLVARNCVLKPRLATRMSLTLGGEALVDERRACRL
jgi:hypothetical protein